MTRATAVLLSLIFFVLAPGTVVGLVPWWISGWRVHAVFPGMIALQILGGLLIVAGSWFVLDSFARFALHGLGTPAPPLPPGRLVAVGYYRYVRNPMYVGGLTAVLGQAMLFTDVRLLIYAASFWLITHLFVVFYEEPTLRAKFGAEYDAFCAGVPRWIPRLTPWRGVE